LYNIYIYNYLFGGGYAITVIKRSF
jgi:hypothetical protein